MFTITIPIRLVNETNAREHWAVRAKRSKLQRAGTFTFINRARKYVVPELLNSPPWIITISRIGKRKMDSDNLAISAKHVRDGIADALEVNDGDESKVKWEYKQEMRKYYATKIEIHSANGKVP